MLYWVVLVACLVLASGYSSGPPSSVCSTILPGHNNLPGETTPVPYSIILSQTTYSPGEQIRGKTELS